MNPPAITGMMNMTQSSAQAQATPAPAGAPAAAPATRTADTFVYCFNTSTIRGQRIPLAQEVDLLAKAGYHAIEPWINEIEMYLRGGGKLPDNFQTGEFSFEHGMVDKIVKRKDMRAVMSTLVKHLWGPA